MPPRFWGMLNERRQQDMSLRADRARRTLRPSPHRAVLIPDTPRPRVTPRSKLALTARATKIPIPQELVDLERVRTYHQHQVPLQHQATALPSGQGTGRAAASTGHRHALVANQEGNPTGTPFRRSSPSTTPDTTHDVIHGVAQQLGLPVAPRTYRAWKSSEACARARSDAALLDTLLHVRTGGPEGRPLPEVLYGRRKMTAWLTRNGFPDVSKHTVDRLMRHEGMNGLVRGRSTKTTVSAKTGGMRAGGLLNRVFTSPRPNHACVTDLSNGRAGEAPVS